MIIVCIRTILLYSIVVLVMRLMGKRQIGELEPYEFVITIMISDLASLPMQDQRYPLLQGIVPIITLLFLKTLITQIELKIQSARNILDGSPCILIYNGKINYDALKKQQINLDELFEELRLAKCYNLNEIQYAILENSGQLSILPKNYNTNNSSSDKTSNSKLIFPKILVADGKINKNSITSINKDSECIMNTLKKHGIDNIDNILIAMYDTEGKFFVQYYDDYEKECAL
ncbi:DUF421 domain-containing protein [uncultured Clostridium sp.]|uniref:DUF421 domain-containing protein n=1 Tax=uncultured Clostridium sp. TaxID=59620 RepID=UPI0025E6EDEF|nr:DUF421 domain-containing protein [uncultured Clostridium sp.]